MGRERLIPWSGAGFGGGQSRFLLMLGLFGARRFSRLECSLMRRQNPFGSTLTAIFVIILACASVVTGIELGTFLRVIGR